MTTISHWVNNEVFAGASGATAPVTNPAAGAPVLTLLMARFFMIGASSALSPPS